MYGLALGYEDLNDHDQLRTDSLLGVLAGKSDPCGEDRRSERDQGKPLAGNQARHGSWVKHYSLFKL